MTSRRLIIPVFSMTVLTGLYLLGHLLADIHSGDLPLTQALLSDITSSPLSWGYALTSGMAFIVFLAWVPTQLPVWRIVTAFRHVDSTSLDEHTELCQRFYRALLEFRCHYGETRFMQQLVTRFNFDDKYHKDALNWMNKIIRRVDAASIPTNMIIDCICSGHIGRVYSGCYYGGGLPSAFIRFDEAIYLLARMDSVEIWSASSRTPICAFVRHDLQLESNHHSTHYDSAILSGKEKSTGKIRQLELRIPVVPANAQQTKPRSTRGNIEELQSWLAILMLSANHTPMDNYGIEVTEIPSLQEAPTLKQTQTPLNDVLQQMLGRYIDAILNQATQLFSEPDLGQSTIVLCSGLGIVTITDVPLAGIIHYSGEPYWMQIDIDSSQRFGNACLAAQRCSAVLNNQLTTVGLNRWPIHNLVVFSHNDAHPELELGRQQVQCDVITLEQLPKWFASQPVDGRICFTKDDYNEFITLLKPVQPQRAQIKHA